MNTQFNAAEAERRSTTCDEDTRYDTTSIVLHWITAVLVFVQFGLAETWEFLPKDTRHLMIVGHMSFGILLTVTIIVRICWHQTFGRNSFETGPSIISFAARMMHRLLYVLVVAEVILGFLTRWTDNQALSFFGLLIQSPFGTCSKAIGGFVDQIHDINAWLIMSLVMLHTVAALAHHYVLRDDVLVRMMPRSWST